MNKDRVTEIDLLRFLAAIVVMLFHYTFRGYAADNMSIMPYPWLAGYLKYGYLGVELFFMISGFVILMSASSGSLKSFAISRFIRLYPAFWVCCTITFLVIKAIGGTRYTATFDQYAVNMTMLSGFFNVDSIDGVYWSLFEELKFYALVGIVLAFRKLKYVEPLLVVWLLASIVLQFVHVKFLNFMLIIEYSAFFIAGCAFYLVWKNGYSASRIFLIVVSWFLALYLVTHDLGRWNRDYHTVYNPYFISVIVTMFFVIMLLVARRRLGYISRRNWMAVGMMTYPLYLLHQLIGFMIFNRAYPAVNPHLLLWSVISMVLVLAYAVNVWIERPMSKSLKKSLEYIFRSRGGAR
jgi:peptidoglycan/LPS O-acetylase OafA/YrhL